MSEAHTTILLIRHATTAMVGKAFTGWLPGVPLDENGREQARKLVERLANVRIDRILSSPLQRTLETAQPLCRARQLNVTENRDFGEINFGRWQGSLIKDLAEDAEFKRFNAYRSGTRAPGGELMLETQARMVRGLLQTGADYPGEHVAIFSHADAIKTAIMHALGIPIDFHHRLEIAPASVSICQLFSDLIRVLGVNITGTASPLD